MPAQAWIFWAAVAVLNVALLGGMWSAFSWLWPQRSDKAANIHVFLTSMSGIWACQQLFDWIMLPLLSMRAFHGSLTLSRDAVQVSVTTFACYVRDWSVLCSWPAQASIMLALLWYIYTSCSLPAISCRCGFIAPSTAITSHGTMQQRQTTTRQASCTAQCNSLPQVARQQRVHPRCLLLFLLQHILHPFDLPLQSHHTHCSTQCVR